MNATELFHADGRPAGIYYCGACRRLGGLGYTRAAADACCRPTACACGAGCEPSWTVCPACREANDVDRETAQFEKACKVYAEEYAGEFVCVDGDRYVDPDDLEYWAADSLFEWWQDARTKGKRPWQYDPPRVYGTLPSKPTMDTHGWIENALEESHEDAIDDIGNDAIAELHKFVTAWCEAHLPTSYYEDQETALVPWPPIEGGDS